MKVWKMVGCLALLCVIVAGCVVMARGTEVAAETPPEEEKNENSTTNDTEGEASSREEENGSATVSKTYSEGLYFRSNGDGTCALSGMGSCTAVCVLIPPRSPAGDVVTEILPYAFANSIVGAIEIPTTVREVSAASFDDCPRLSYIRVSAGNEHLSESDGVLYNGDGSVLLYCPVGRSAKTLTLHPALQRIAAGAFAACDGLETVCFGGSTAEWHNIIVGDENDALYAASLRFSAS